MPAAIDMSGRKYGRLTVVKFAGRRNPGSRTSRRQWLCCCDCGTETVVDGDGLRSGHTQSCGCLLRERIGESNRLKKTTHGRRGTPEYRSWQAMKSRCNNPNATGYHNYGGRGIEVCDRWMRSFEAFLEDMGTKPSLLHELDRIDNDGDYCPENCRWATVVLQSRNRRTNIMLTYQGVCLSLPEWSDIIGIRQGTLHSRLKNGWPVEAALTTPLQSQFSHTHRTEEVA